MKRKAKDGILLKVLRRRGFRSFRSNPSAFRKVYRLKNHSGERCRVYIGFTVNSRLLDAFSSDYNYVSKSGDMNHSNTLQTADEVDNWIDFATMGLLR